MDDRLYLAVADRAPLERGDDHRCFRVCAVADESALTGQRQVDTRVFDGVDAADAL